FLEMGDGLPTFRPPLDMNALFGEPQIGDSDGTSIAVRYLTPHNKWAIHSMYQENFFMMSLGRGGQTIWMSVEDAEAVGIADNDWIEAINRNGVVAARAVVSHRMPKGTAFMHHAQERTVNVPLTETTGQRGGIHNSLTRIMIKPTHLVGGYGQLSSAFHYYGPTGNQRDEVTVIRRRSNQNVEYCSHGPHTRPAPDTDSGTGGTAMRIMAQMAMVMNLDKCIGCHTCSVTCKQAWTNRKGTEYVWFNNVETRPGQGYPRGYEDQEKWQGGWALSKNGRLKLKAGGKLKKLASIFSNPKLPGIEDYYEPWSYEYDNLLSAPEQEHIPTAPPKALLNGERMANKWSGNWDDDLGGTYAKADLDPMLKSISDKVKLEFEQTFMFYLPRICEHCLNPSCVASCPSGAIYKREEDGIVLVDLDSCRGWRMCISGCPYKKIYFNLRTGKAEKCTFCYPRMENGEPTVCAAARVRRLRYRRPVFYDADRATEAASVPRAKDLVRAQQAVTLDPRGPDVMDAADPAGIPRDWIMAPQRPPVYKLSKDSDLA